jgi:sirohydrochlorin ferrochelatase
VVLAAHGSRDPRSAETIRSLAAGVAARRRGTVTAAFLDFDTPTVPAALRAVPPAPPPVVVPALLTSAYHGRVDVPEVLAASGVKVRLTNVLGPAAPGQEPHPLLLAALHRRLRELKLRFDGLVLIAAGTSHTPARITVDTVASALAAQHGVACAVGYASASAPAAAEAVSAVRARGARRIAAASYFLAPGRLYDAAAGSARSAGAVGVAEPLGAAQEVVELLLHRITTAELP